MAKSTRASKGTETPVNEKIGKNEPIQSRQFLRHDFTPDEIMKKGQKLAQLSAEKIAIENDKKAAMSDFKAKIDGKDAEMKIIMQDINTGHGQEYVNCITKHHDPTTAMQTIYREDTGEIVRTESMSMEDLQVQMELHDAPLGDPNEENEDRENDDKNNP